VTAVRLHSESVRPTLHLDRLEAVMVDVDDVVADAEQLHAIAWQNTFEEFLRRRTGSGERVPDFEVPADYLRYARGRPSEETVRDFLTARGVKISTRPADPSVDAGPSEDTVASLAARKDLWFTRELRARGARPFPAAVELLHELRARGLRTAAVSWDRNARQLLASAHVADLFDVTFDGADVAALGLPPAPDPGVLVEVAHRLGVSPRRTAVVTSRLAEVTAAWHGCFEPIVAVDRRGCRGELYEAGAHVVVDDLADLVLVGRRHERSLVRR
jgi:beta-phosphoglucomutase-like phosphatase (HAD superfamily)